MQQLRDSASLRAADYSKLIETPRNLNDSSTQNLNISIPHLNTTNSTFTSDQNIRTIINAVVPMRRSVRQLS
jgi:hypothetical protein